MSKQSRRKDKIEVTELTRGKLEKEIKRSRELLKLLGAAYYASLLTARQLGHGRLPPQTPVPTEWMKLAHQLMEGQTLQDVNFSISEGNPEDSYVSFFEDSTMNMYVFTHNLITGATTLRVGENEDTISLAGLPPEPETHLWFQASLLAAIRKRARRVGGQFEITYTAWDVILDIASQFRDSLERDVPLNQTLNVTVMERAHQIATPFLDKVRGALKPKEEPVQEQPKTPETTEQTTSPGGILLPPGVE